MKTKLHRVLVFSDNQIPYHHRRLFELLVEFIKDFVPHAIIINGDFIDCYALSKYRRHPTLQQGKSFKEEVAVAKECLIKIRRAAPHAEILYTFGNHELRLEKYLAENAEELIDLFTLEDALGCKQLGIKVYKNDLKENYVDYKNKVLVGHFDKFSSIPGNTARGLVIKKGRSIVQGHTHHSAVVSWRLHDGEVFGIESGCLADERAVYAMLTDWTQGFTLLYFDPQDNWWFDQIFIRNHSFVANGKLYR